MTTWKSETRAAFDRFTILSTSTSAFVRAANSVLGQISNSFSLNTCLCSPVHVRVHESDIYFVYTDAWGGWKRARGRENGEGRRETRAADTACTHTQTHTKNVSILRCIHTYRRYMVYQHISLSVPPSLVSLYLSFPLLKVCAKTRSIHFPRGLRAIAYLFNDSCIHLFIMYSFIHSFVFYLLLSYQL